MKAEILKNKIKEKNSGITLIALVITIIVLLILAGVSIAMLAGQNGILTQAQNAKKENEIASVKEQAQLDITNYVIEKLKNGQDSTVNTPEKVKEILDATNQEESRYYAGYTETGVKTPSGYEVPYEELYTTASNGEEEPPKTAGDLLKVNPGATEAKDKSPYVKYNNMLCRVLYNDMEHGIQIVTADNGVVEDVKLGAGDEKVTADEFTYDGPLTNVDDMFKKEAASYNDVVNNLNERAVEYVDKKGIAKGARSLGSIATLENGKFQTDTSGMLTGTHESFTKYKWNEKFKVGDTNYEDDIEQINALGLNATSGFTWLASRYVESYSNSSSFSVRMVNTSGNLGDLYLCAIHFDGAIGTGGSPTEGFRPIFLLTSDVVISSGEGSSENPYVIE